MCNILIETPQLRVSVPLPCFIFLCITSDLTYDTVHSCNCWPRMLAPQEKGFWILITATSPVPRKVPGTYLVLDKYLLNK